MNSSTEDYQLKRKDLLWILAYPVYQIIGTIRHEGSHALAAMAEGVEVKKLVFWPNLDGGHFSWGYVSWQGYPTWFVRAAPYFCDLMTFCVAILIILQARPRHRWLWLNIGIVGMLSPLINTAPNYFQGVAGAGSWNDIGKLLSVLDPIAVHLYFALTLMFYAWRLYHCYFRKRTWHPK